MSLGYITAWERTKMTRGKEVSYVTMLLFWEGEQQA